MINAAAPLVERWHRIPKFVLFGAAALLQLALLALMVFDHAHTLRAGTEVTLQTRPVDPRDFLRGDYVALGYDISQLPANLLQDQPGNPRKPIVFVKLAPNRDGLYEAISVHTEPVPVQGREVLIRGRITSFDVYKLWIRYGLESYFVPQGEGKKLEDGRNQRRLTVVAAVLPSGRAAIKRLLVDGEPAYDEPWF